MTRKKYIAPGYVSMVNDRLIFNSQAHDYTLSAGQTVIFLATPSRCLGIQVVLVRTDITIGSGHGGPITEERVGYVLYRDAIYKTTHLKGRVRIETLDIRSPRA